MKDSDDKQMVIFAVFLICVVAMVAPDVQDSAYQLVEKALYGLFGIAVGKALK